MEGWCYQWRSRWRRHSVPWPSCPLRPGPHSHSDAPMEVLLVAFLCFTRFSFGWALVFLTPYLHTCAASLYFSQITYACFCLLYVSFLCLSFVRSSLFNFCLFSYLSLRRWYLKNQQAHLDLTSLRDHMLWDSSKQISEQAKDCAPGLRSRVTILLFAFFFPLRVPNSTISWLLKLRLPPSLHIPHQLFLLCKYEVQQRAPPFHDSSVTSIRSVRLLPVVWRRLHHLVPDKAVYSRLPLECDPHWPALRWAPHRLVVCPQAELSAFQRLSHTKSDSPFPPPRCGKTSWTVHDVWEGKPSNLSTPEACGLNICASFRICIITS